MTAWTFVDVYVDNNKIFKTLEENLLTAGFSYVHPELGYTLGDAKVNLFPHELQIKVTVPLTGNIPNIGPLNPSHLTKDAVDALSYIIKIASPVKMLDDFQREMDMSLYNSL